MATKAELEAQVQEMRDMILAMQTGSTQEVEGSGQSFESYVQKQLECAKHTGNVHCETKGNFLIIAVDLKKTVPTKSKGDNVVASTGHAMLQKSAWKYEQEKKIKKLRPTVKTETYQGKTQKVQSWFTAIDVADGLSLSMMVSKTDNKKRYNDTNES